MIRVATNRQRVVQTEEAPESKEWSPVEGKSFLPGDGPGPSIYVSHVSHEDLGDRMVRRRKHVAGILGPLCEEHFRKN